MKNERHTVVNLAQFNEETQDIDIEFFKCENAGKNPKRALPVGNARMQQTAYTMCKGMSTNFLCMLSFRKSLKVLHTNIIHFYFFFHYLKNYFTILISTTTNLLHVYYVNIASYETLERIKVLL